MEPCKCIYKDEAVFQLINNFNILVLNLKKIITIVSIGLISTLVVYGFYFDRSNFLRITPSLREEVYIYIPTDANFNDVKKIVAPYILQMDRFEKVADKMSYPQNLNSGRFITRNEQL
jgi:UPF0755 protein